MCVRVKIRVVVSEKFILRVKAELRVRVRSVLLGQCQGDKVRLRIKVTLGFTVRIRGRGRPNKGQSLGEV